MLQELGALETELSLCLSFARLRDQRVQNLEQRCQNKPQASRTRCLHRVDVLRARAELAFQVCEHNAVQSASRLTEQRCAIASKLRIVGERNAPEPCDPCGTVKCPDSRRRDTRITARVIVQSPPDVECRVLRLIDAGRFDAGLANCYANAVNPIVQQNKDLRTCLGEVQLCLVSAAAGCPQCELPPVGPDVCSIARDVLGSCLDTTCTQIACDDGDPCTADFCDGKQCRHIPENEGAKCGPLGNACMDDVCSAGKCGRAKVNGTLCDPARKCCFCADGSPHPVTCKAGCFCSDMSGCLSETTGQPCQ